METKVTVSKKLVLQFTLPGYAGATCSRNGPNSPYAPDPHQLTHKGAESGNPEHWVLEVEASTALVTRAVLCELVDAISEAIKKGAL